MRISVTPALPGQQSTDHGEESEETGTEQHDREFISLIHHRHLECFHFLTPGSIILSLIFARRTE